ncbi:MAG: respiratory selenite reductase catalytic subunit SrrA [Bacillota bacterium]
MVNISRRTFLKASAAVGAAASLPLMSSFKDFAKASQDAPIVRIPTMCNGCSSTCGKYVYVKNGRVWKVEGNPINMKSTGKLCARAHGMAADVYGQGRVTQPMKRTGEMSFEPISWAQAFEEIGDKLFKIINKDGGNSVMWLGHGGKEHYASSFLDAIGSANYVTHYATCFSSKTNVWDRMVGTTLNSDFHNSDFMLFVGRNFAGGIIPGVMNSITKAKERGAKIVVIDPRFCELAIVADEWIPIRPGTDLALFLGIAHTLISENLYAKDFVNSFVYGFDEFWKANKDFNAEKAAEITGIPAEKIREIARQMAAAAPKAFLDSGYHGLHAHYANSTQIAMANVIVNALLGNMFQVGGLMPSAEVQLGHVETPARQNPEKGPRADGAGVDNEYPTVEPSRGIPQIVPDLIKKGRVKALFIYHYNPLRTAPDPEYQKGLKEAELVVSIPVDWNETSLYTAHYILPESYYLERTEPPKAVSGFIAHDNPQIAVRKQAIKPIHNTLPLLDILKGVTAGAGYYNLYPYTVEEEIAAAIKPLGISPKVLMDTGCIEFPSSVKAGFPLQGGKPALKTFTGKVEFSIGAFKLYGRQGVPTWVPPLVVPEGEDEFRLIHGKQPWHSHHFTSNNPFLMAISDKYKGTWMWLNKKRADKLGIKDGDLVQVSSEKAVREVYVKVTELLHPDCVWIPSAYGGFSEKLKTAYQKGINYNDFIPARVEPLSGTVMGQEVIVKISKGGVK